MQIKFCGTSASVQLEDVVPYALDFIDDNENGFVIMLEQAYIDKYSHNNDFDNMVKSVTSLNNTVEAIMRWVGTRTDTAILITADHETGGLLVENNTEFYFTSTNHTQSLVGLYTYGISPEFKKFDFYSSNDKIKNINTYKVMCNLL